MRQVASNIFFSIVAAIPYQLPLDVRMRNNILKKKVIYIFYVCVYMCISVILATPRQAKREGLKRERRRRKKQQVNERREETRLTIENTLPITFLPSSLLLSGISGLSGLFHS